MKSDFFRDDVISIKERHYSLGNVDEYGRRIIVPIESAPKDLKDQKIFRDIELALSESPDVNASRIKVVVLSGHVTLTGIVSNLSQKFECEDIVHNIKGVHSVINDIEVKDFTQSDISPRDEFGYH